MITARDFTRERLHAVLLFLISALFLMGTHSYGKDQELTKQINHEDLLWRVVNDNVMGGRSTGSLRMTEENVQFQGSTNTNGGGFASIRSSPQELNLDGFEKVRMQIKGDGRTYTVILRERRARVSYWSRVETSGNGWQEIEVEFSSFWPNFRGQRLPFREVDPSRVVEVGIMIYDGEDGPFQLEIKNLEFI